MKISHLFLLGAMLLITPVVTQAQVTVLASSESGVAAGSSVHASIDWAKSSVDEMDATLALLKKNLGDLKSESRH
jgi:hypothetical protein